MRPLIFGLLALLPAADAPRAQGPTAMSRQSISGRVSDARDNAPLRRARVTILHGARRDDAAVFTDDDGRFVLIDIPSAGATIQVTKAGFAAAQADARSGAELRFALARSAAVMGRIVDTAGAPVRGAYVTARLIPPGTASPPAAGSHFFVQTDRLGEYRLGGLPAGRYEITGLRFPPEMRPAGGSVEAVLLGPRDAFDLDRPVTFALNPGDELHEINFTLPRREDTCPPAPGAPPPPGTAMATIEGRITSVSGEPMSCTIVRIFASDAPMRQVHTDRQGRYTIGGLSAGAFSVLAIKSGYILLRHGQRHPADDEVHVTVRAGEHRENVDIVLPRESLIAGTVVDEHGEPMEGITVSAFPIVGAQPIIMPIPAGRTDDRGRYRIIGATPGAYLVSARASGDVSMPGRPRGYLSIYHPGTPDMSTAFRVSVDAGRDVDGVDIVAASVFTAVVSGTVVDATGGPFVGAVSLTRSGRSGAVSVSIDARSAQTDRDGAFVIRNVPRGDYVLKAPGSAGSTTFGMHHVTVDETDPPPVTLVLTEGARVEGRFVVETLLDANLAGLTVSFLPADSDRTPVGGFKAPIFGREPDDTFRMTGLVGPARITVSPLPACDTCYLKSALVNGADAVDAAFDFGLKGGTYRDVEVVVSDAGAAIEARVVDERALMSNVFVIAIPAREDLRFSGSRHQKIARRLPDGTFRLAGLPPGDYLVGAARRADAYITIAPELDADLLALVIEHGTRVTVLERERRMLDLRLIRR